MISKIDLNITNKLKVFAKSRHQERADIADRKDLAAEGRSLEIAELFVEYIDVNSRHFQVP